MSISYHICLFLFWQCSDTTSSNAMEVMGLRKSLDFLIGQGLKISTLITDRHPSVTKMMREDYPHILHFFDVWHIAKGMVWSPGVNKKIITETSLFGVISVVVLHLTR